MTTRLLTHAVPRSHLFNIRPEAYMKFRAARARTDRPTRVACLGDSTVRGQATGGGDTQASFSWPAQLATQLERLGIPAGANNLFGFGNGFSGGSWAALVAGDSRLTSSGGWTIQGVETAGGLAFGASEPGAMTFTPDRPVTRFTVYATRNNGHGSFAWSVDGGAATTVSQSGAAGISKTEITGLAPGAHALTLSWVSGTARILGIDAADDTRPELSIWNLGICGADSERFLIPVGQPYYRPEMQEYLAPDLTLLQGGVINDWRNATPVATVRANLEAIIDSAGLSGDVLLLAPVWDAGSTGATADQELYVDMMREVAVARGIGLVDIRSSWGSWEAADAVTLYSDPVHPNTIGYGDIARQVARALAAL